MGRPRKGEEKRKMRRIGEPKVPEPPKEEVVKVDGRRNNGAVKGISRGQGRKPKAKEEDIKNFSLKAMKKVFGSEDKAWLKLAELSQNSFPHLRLLWEYKYGKPKEQKDLNVKAEINIPIVNFLDKEKTIDIESEEVKGDE
jgi:hypothetical protein